MDDQRRRFLKLLGLSGAGVAASSMGADRLLDRRAVAAAQSGSRTLSSRKTDGSGSPVVSLTWDASERVDLTDHGVSPGDAIGGVVDELWGDDTLIEVPPGRYTLEQGWDMDGHEHFGIACAEPGGEVVLELTQDAYLSRATFFAAQDARDVAVSGITADVTGVAKGAEMALTWRGQALLQDFVQVGQGSMEMGLSCYNFDPEDVGVIEGWDLSYGNDTEAVESGILVQQQTAGTVHIDDCVINHMSSKGVYASQLFGNDDSGEGTVHVTNCRFHNNSLYAVRHANGTVAGNVILLDDSTTPRFGRAARDDGFRWDVPIPSRTDVGAFPRAYRVQQKGGDPRSVFRDNQVIVRDARSDIELDGEEDEIIPLFAPGGAGSTVFRDNRVLLRSPDLQVMSVGQGGDDITVTGDQYTIELAGEAAIRTLADAGTVTFTDCCFDMQDEHALFDANTPVTVDGGSIALHGSPLNAGGAAIQRSGTTDGAACAAPTLDPGTGGGTDDGTDGGAGTLVVVRGTGTSTHYAITVDGSIRFDREHGDVEDHDRIDGEVARGWVTTPSHVDAYRVEGDITDIRMLQGEAEVTIDGTPVADTGVPVTRYDDRFTVSGGSADDPLHYAITVNGVIDPISDEQPVGADQAVLGTTALGTVTGDTDRYAFRGSVTRFDAEDGVTVSYQGTEMSPAEFRSRVAGRCATGSGTGDGSPGRGSDQDGRAAADKLRDAYAFDREVDAVDDLGVDPAGEEPIDEAIEAVEDGTLVLFPDGTYTIGDRIDLRDRERVALVGRPGADVTVQPGTPRSGYDGDPITVWLTGDRVGVGGFTRDVSGDGYGGEWIIEGRGGGIRVCDIDQVGMTGGSTDSFWLGVTAGAEGVVERVRLRDGAHRGFSATGFQVRAWHAGTLRFVDCDAWHFPSKGLYASGPAEGGGGGSIHVEGGVWRNNNDCDWRLGTGGSTIRDAVSIKDGSREGGTVTWDRPIPRRHWEVDGEIRTDIVHTRSIRLKGGETDGDVTIAGCEFDHRVGEGSAVIMDQVAYTGTATVRDCRIHVDGLDIDPVRIEGGDPMVLENVAITGSTADGVAIVSESGGTEIRDCCIGTGYDTVLDGSAAVRDWTRGGCQRPDV